MHLMERHDANPFELWVEGPVVSWKRNRVGPGGRVFRDTKSRDYRRLVAAQAQLVCRHQLRAPVALELVFVFPRTARRPGRVPSDAWRAGSRLLRPTTNRDDIDRLQGNVLDALCDAGVLGDDGHVVSVKARKVWAAEGEEAGLLVRAHEVQWEVMS